MRWTRDQRMVVDSLPFAECGHARGPILKDMVPITEVAPAVVTGHLSVLDSPDHLPSVEITCRAPVQDNALRTGERVPGSSLPYTSCRLFDALPSSFTGI